MSSSFDEVALAFPVLQMSSAGMIVQSFWIATERQSKSLQNQFALLFFSVVVIMREDHDRYKIRLLGY